MELSPAQLMLAAVLLGLQGTLSWRLRLGLERRLAVAGLRTVIQLSILGLVLVPVFASGSPLAVALIVMLMLGVAGAEAVRRTKRKTPALVPASTIALASGSLCCATFGSYLVLGVEPFYTPRYFIPLVGMLLGNSLTALSLGFDSLLEGLDVRRDQVEYRLAAGATWWEAVHGELQQALRTAMVPIINAMSAVGLVTIPGMMTGQILGGTDPVLAARYQVVILFLIAGSVTLAATLGAWIVARGLFDVDHRLLTERIGLRDELEG